MIEAEALGSSVRPELSAETQKRHAEAAAHALEALVSRLQAGDTFKDDFTSRPLATLTSAGIVLEKEGMEFLMTHDPDRFDRLTDALFDLMDADLLASLTMPSCDPPVHQ